MSATVLSVRLPDSLAGRLERLSAETHRAQSYYVRDALAAHIERMEWEQRVSALAEAARAGRVATQPMSEVAEEFGVSLEMSETERNELLAGVE